MNRIIICIYLFILPFAIKAQSGIDSLLQQVDSTKIDIKSIELYYAISNAFRDSDNHKALEFAQKGLKLSVVLNDSLQLSKGHMHIGNALIDLGLYNKALDEVLDSRKFAENIHDTMHMAKILNAIGNIYYFQKNYKTALKFYLDALPYAIAAKDKDFEIVLNFNIGLIYKGLNINDSSMFYLRKTLYLSQLSNKKTNEAFVLLALASRFLDRELLNLDSAKYYLNETKKNESYLSISRRASLYNNFASMNMELGNFGEAKKNLEKAKRYAHESKKPYSIQAYLKYQFEYDSSTHNYQSAMVHQLLLKQLKDSVSSSELKDKIANFQVIYDAEKKESEIAILKSENEIYNLKNKHNSYLMGIFVLVFLFSILILIAIIRSNKIKNKSIEGLNQINAELRSNKEEMTSLNEELSMNQEELYEKNHHLESLLKQLQLTQNHLIQSEKITSVGILARGVAHELINPLNFINGGISILQEIQEEDAQVREKTELPLQMMNEGIVRSVNIVKQLSTFVDQGNTQPQLTDINQVIKSTLSFVNHKIDLNVQIFEEYGEIDECYCFPDKIHTIMFQLLLNAIDAIKEISDNKLIKINTSIIAVNGEQKVKIELFNSGNPISAENLPKLFDPFFTTKDANKGTGLGLTLVYNLVKEQQGTIEVQNFESGVLFTVTIPKVFK